ENLQQRLRVVEQDIAAFDVGQFVEQHAAQLERGQLVREWLWNENDRPPQSAYGRTARGGRKLKPDVPPDLHLPAASLKELSRRIGSRDCTARRRRDPTRPAGEPCHQGERNRQPTQKQPPRGPKL